MKQINQLQLIAIKFFVSKDYTIDSALKRCNVDRRSFYQSKCAEMQILVDEIIELNTLNKALRRTKIRREAAADMVSEGLPLNYFDIKVDNIDNSIMPDTIIPIDWIGRGEGYHSTHGTERYIAATAVTCPYSFISVDIIQIANYNFDKWDNVSPNWHGQR